MNKSELIELLAEQTDLSKSGATRALDAVLDGIVDALREGDSVVLSGFGTFHVKDRAARMGRNPKTGEPVAIKAAKVPGFKPGKSLKDLLNN